MWAISSDTHQLHYIPNSAKAPLYNIIIVDTVRRQKRFFKHENNEVNNIARHIATLACMVKACPPPGKRARHISTIRNVKIAPFENVVLLLHPRVDVPYSLVVT